MKTRKRQFREALKIIRPLTQTGRVDFDGKYFSAHLEELPKLKKKIHMIIGGRAPSVVKADGGVSGTNGTSSARSRSGFDEVEEDRSTQCGRHIEISRMGPFMVAENAAGS